MGVGEVGDVDVVADARAVRSGVVVAEHHRCAAHGDAVEDDRDEVHHRGVGELRPPGAGDVEVAQLDRTQAVAGGVVDHPLPHELRLPVRVDRAAVDLLRHDPDVGYAVDRGRGGEHHRGDVRGLHRGEQVRQPLDVVAVVPERALHRLPHLLLRCEVDDRGDRVLLHYRPQPGFGVGGRQVELDQRGVRHAGGDAVGEVVDDDDLLAALLEEADDVGADVPGPAGDQCAHERLTPFVGCDSGTCRCREHRRFPLEDSRGAGAELSGSGQPPCRRR